MQDKCLICNNQVQEFQPLHDKVRCRVCGTYFAKEIFYREMYESSSGSFKMLDSQLNYLLSAVIREKHDAGETVVISSLDDLTTQIPFKNDPFASIDRLLLYVYRKSTSLATYLQLDTRTDYPVSYARDSDEFFFFIEKAKELGYVETKHHGMMMHPFVSLRLSLKGWECISELRRQRTDSRQAFVAMWFSEDLKEAFMHGFRPALKATGYEPFRVDMREHNGKIDDLIIAEVRKSGLLVADFTGHRGGVYFEAGFAMGLGIPVIWTCRSDDVAKLHFDTRQYNHIIWENLGDLKEKLQLRIEASLPNRPK